MIKDNVSSLIEQDQQHRSLALDANQSFIVQAPAGSGKTELLIQRFLTLLTHVNAPEEILAITFTKKAANEMRLRVVKALKQACHEAEPESAHAKKTWVLAKRVLQRDNEHQWNLISNPNQLRIQTIDSLCSYLTKQLPLLSHFGSPPDIAENPSVLYREAVQEVLMHVEENYAWSQDITRLLLHLDNDLNKLHDLLVSLLAKRDQWLSYIQFSSNDTDIKKLLERQLQLVISDTLQSSYDIFPKQYIAELLAIARFAAAHLPKIEADTDILACQDITRLPGTSFKDQRIWIGLAKILLTKSFSWRKRVDEDIGFPALKHFKNPSELAIHTEYRQRFNTLITALSHCEPLRLALVELFYLPNAHYSDAQWEILQSLLHVLKIVAAQLRVTFQQHGQIDFIENTQAALAALGNDENPTDLALALDYHIQHILIDEFQDTSYTQYQLLEKLTKGWETNDGRTLFVVGDPMQSIYRFREAEVGLFIRMRSKGLHNIELTPLTLAVNFRSASSIVEWNNAHFHGMFPPINDMATGAVSYSPSVSSQLKSTTHDNTIEVRGFVDSADEIEATYLIELIHSIKNKHPNDTIAILVRSRPHLTAIMPALKKAKITYKAIDIDPLASRQSIQDLLSLTCALLHPADRIAWLSILRAPWCGLSLADLLVIAGSDPQAAIFNQLEKGEVRQRLSDDGRNRIEKILPLLRAKMLVRERYDLRTWIESTWLLLGGPAYLNEYSDINDTNAYFKLLESISSHTALLNLDQLKERINQLYASTQHDDATIHIMTIHTAKGLEFDSVILPQCDRKNPSDDKSLLSWMERPLSNEQIALLLAPVQATGNEKDPTYEYINRQQRIKSDYETDRLFYVAATRAKKRLYLSFNVARKDNNEVKIESGSFLAKIWPQLEKIKSDILVFNHDESATDTQQKMSRPIQRIHPTWINPIKELSFKSIAAHKQQQGFQLTDHTAQLIGTATHRVIQQLTHTGVARWLNQPVQEKLVYLQFLLKQLGVSSNQTEFASQMVFKSIENMINDERGKWILHAHTEAKSEYALTTIINYAPVSMIIDRTFIDENDTLWIIDYKTTTLSDSDLEIFLNKEQEKYRDQMQKYYLALKALYSHPIRLGLYFPALPAWREWE